MSRRGAPLSRGEGQAALSRATGVTELPEWGTVAPPHDCLPTHHGRGTWGCFLEAIWQLESKGLKICTAFNPAVPFPGICPRNTTP